MLSDHAVWRRAAAWLLLAAAAGARADLAWPVLEAPQGAHVEQVAGDLVLNGQHSRVSRFTLAGSVDDVLAFYRSRFGARHVENKVGDARAIAAQIGDRFVTVRVSSVLSGLVDATVIETQVGGGRNHSKVALDTQAMLPAGSTVLQTQESSDDDMPSLMVMASNRVGLQANRDAIVGQLQARGFHVLREDTSRVAGHGALTLALTSSTEDAAVTVSDAGPYRSLLIQRNRRQP